MRLMRKFATGLFFIALVLCAMAQTVRANPLRPRTESLSLGLIAVNAEKKTAQHQEFVDYLTRKVFARADRHGTVMVVPAAAQLAQLLVEGKVDFFMESAYPTHVIGWRSGSRPILRRWKHGASEYRGVIVARKDGGIEQLSDLLGKTIVFEDAESTSGYFLPKSFFIHKGFELRQKSSLNDPVAPQEIGFVFAGAREKNIVDWVLTDKAAAGAFSDVDLNRIDAKHRAALAVLAETDALPRHLVSVRKELRRAIEDRLQEILLGMHQNPEGLRILKKLDNTTKFDLFNVSQTEMQVKLLDVFFRRSSK